MQHCHIYSTVLDRPGRTWIGGDHYTYTLQFVCDVGSSSVRGELLVSSFVLSPSGNMAVDELDSLQSELLSLQANVQK